MANLRSQRQAVYKDYKAIVSSSKKELPRRQPGSNRLIRAAYLVNQRRHFPRAAVKNCSGVYPG